MNRRLKTMAWSSSVIAILGISFGVYVFTHMSTTLPTLGLVLNYVRYLNAPAGTLTTQINSTATAASTPLPLAVIPAVLRDDDWPSYNRTLTSERYSPLSEINAKTVRNLKILCTYDTRQYTSFEPGLIMVNGALIGTTLTDIFSIDPATCQENWRTREDLPAAILTAMRGAAYFDGKLFRGSQDGRVLAYDFKTGVAIGETTIGNTSHGEFAAAAPIAWNGLVFIGNAGGDAKGGRGACTRSTPRPAGLCGSSTSFPRPKAINRAVRKAPRRSIIELGKRARLPDQRRRDLDLVHAGPGGWRLYVPVGNPSPAYAVSVREGENPYPRLGRRARALRPAPTSATSSSCLGTGTTGTSPSAPALIHTAGGKRLLSAAPKDGHLYGIDLADKRPPLSHASDPDRECRCAVCA